MTGGPPVRGEMLGFWRPAGPPDDALRDQWIQTAERIATGITVLAHLDTFVDPDNLRVGFSCDGDADLANRYVWSIFGENVAAQRVAPVVPGRADLPLDDVILPCAPAMSGDTIKHVVLATLKAAHALEFDSDDEVVGSTW